MTRAITRKALAVLLLLTCLTALAVAAYGYYRDSRVARDFVGMTGEYFASDECPSHLGGGPRVTCGTLTAPADHWSDDDLTVEMPVVVVHPRRPNGQGVLMTGGGGPGSTVGFDDVDAVDELFPAHEVLLEEGYTLVVVEERGVGGSQPDGTCTELFAVEAARLAAVRLDVGLEEQRVAAASACRARLAMAGYAPRHFTLAQSAADMALLTETLPLERWTLFGHSHGTAVTLATAYLGPPDLERLVLSAPVDLPGELPYSYGLMRQRVLHALQACVDDPVCQSRYPDVPGSLADALERAAAEPLALNLSELETPDGERAKPGRVHYDEPRLTELLFEMSYWPDEIAALPALLEDIAAGEVGALAEIAVERSGDDHSAGDAAALTVDCGFYRPRQQRHLTADPELERQWSDTSRMSWFAEGRVCDAWGAPSSELADEDLLSVGLPVLLIAGELDPITPADGARSLALVLPDATLVVDPLGAHSVVFESTCAQAWLMDFLEGEAPGEWVAGSCDAPSAGIDWHGL